MPIWRPPVAGLKFCMGKVCIHTPGCDQNISYPSTWLALCDQLQSNLTLFDHFRPLKRTCEYFAKKWV